MPRAKAAFWNEFTLIAAEENDTAEKYSCNHCNIIYVKNASRMQKHIESCTVYQSKLEQTPERIDLQIPKKRIQHTLDGFAQSFSESDQLHMEGLLGRAFFSSGISMNCIENPDMQAFLKKSMPWFKIPSRYVLSNTILDREYKKLSYLVGKTLNNSPEFVCITSDGWSNINKLSIINYMITTPKPFFYKATSMNEERHTAENIANGIETIIEEVGTSKVAAVITDNAANMKAAWRILQRKYPQKIFLGCWAHAIHLWIKDILNLSWANNIIQDSKNIINYFRNHHIILAILRRIQKEKYNKCISLLLPGETRWGSHFYSLDNLLSTRTAIQSILVEDDITLPEELKQKIISSDLWINIKKLRNLLEPFVNFLQHLQSDTPNLSTVYLKLKDLEDFVISNNDLTQEFKTAVRTSGKNRWINFLYNPVILLAYKLDPQYRGSKLNPSQWDSIIEDELIRLVSTENASRVLEEYAEYLGKLGNFSRLHLWESNLVKNPINWWCLVKGRYPILSEVALKILSIPATSAASERNWNTFGFIHTKVRNRLNDKRVEKLVYMNWNLKIIHDLNLYNELNQIKLAELELENIEEEDNNEIEDEFFSLFDINEYDENGCINIDDLI
jgi:hypothetical protein